MKNKINNFLLAIRNWIRKNPREFWVLIFILLVGAFLRLYKIDQYMTFLGDEGRDVIIVRRLLVDFDLILIGPGTSIGNMYLGPIYYYMMAPFLLLFNFSPVGPAVMVALLGIATIFLVWYMAREWFGKYAAVVASILFAITPVVIIYSRSSWNPNIMPFFALLTIYSVWQFWVKNKYKWLLVAGISTAFAMQSHYLGLLLFPTIGLFWLLSLIKTLRSPKTGSRSQVGTFLKYSVVGGFVFLILMSPLLIFDSRHGWRNFEAIKVFFTQRQTTISARPWSALPKLPEIIQEASQSIIASTSLQIGRLSTIIIGLVLLWLGVTHLKDLKRKEIKAYFLILVWIGIAFIGLGVYKQEIYDHYYGFFFAAPFLLIGGLSEHLIRFRKTAGWLFVIAVVSVLVYVNLSNNPLKYHPNRQLQRSVEVSSKIIEVAGEEKFNLAVIAERNYEGAYQYYLERRSAPILMIDPLRYEETLADQLFVICELPPENCDPVNHPKAEIANFGWSRILDQWEVGGVILYKLGHNR